LDEEVKVTEEKVHHCQEDCRTKEKKDNETSQVFQLMNDGQMKKIHQNPMMWHNLSESEMNDSSNHCEHFLKLLQKGEVHQEEEQQNSRHSQQMSFHHSPKMAAIDQIRFARML
jgi:hypothetical protein